VSLVERGGRVCSAHVRDVNSKSLRFVLTEQIDKATHVMTDTARAYPVIGANFAQHSMVNHGINVYVRGEAYTTTVESYFALQVLRRDVVERAEDTPLDAEGFSKSIPGIVGKRLMNLT
jgi:hypothetical protein